MSRRRLIAVLLALVATAGLAGCGGGDEPLPQQRLTIAAGAPGGVYGLYGRGLAAVVERRLPKLSARAVPTAGSVDNVRRVADGRADIGFTRADSAQDTLRRGATIVALAQLYDSYVQVVARADGDIATVADLERCGARRCRVAIGPSGSGTQLIARRVLAAAGLGAPEAVERIGRLDIGDAADELIAGRVDALFWAGGLPTPAIEKVHERVGMRLVDLGRVAARLRGDFPDVYTETRVPRGVYAAEQSIVTVSVPNYLVARRDLDRRIAYRLTEMLFAHRAELVTRGHEEARYLDRRAAIDTFPLALHEGARRFYRDAAR